MIARRLAALAAALLIAGPAAAAELSPLILEQKPWRPPGEPYGAFLDVARSRFPIPLDPEAFRRDHPEADWKRLREGREVEAFTTVYKVDGLRITGAVVRPVGGRDHPILVWARGGVGEAQIERSQIVEMAWWAAKGYVVVASNYRGAGGSEGKDEFAGADLADLTALIPIGRSLAGTDPSRIYAIGFSRGGTMLYRAAAEGAPLRAFATVGGVTDLASFSEGRPDVLDLLRGMAPDFAEESAGRFCRRSAVCWPERIAAPLMLVHGGGDQPVPPAQAWSLARGLEAAGRPYELLVVGGADHGVSGRKVEVFERIHRFFQAAP
jgi:dipeptidyl aminopeptidase/acylaminoacyl peptidase